ncbi:MAG: DNA mismatch repair endonuclease MutL, partial [Terriglobales bacterium]
NAMLMAPPVGSHSKRIYQIFGKETLDQLLPMAAELDLERVGIPEPPPWRRNEEYEKPVPGKLRLHGFVSKPEIQKLNRNSIFVFVNGRLIRDRLIHHALTDAYRNILPPTVHPVVLLFIDMPPQEVDCNVHPSKVEVRFRQQSVVHDFVRDSVRAALLKARPVAQFTREINAQPSAGQALSPTESMMNSLAMAVAQGAMTPEEAGFALQPPVLPPINERLAFTGGMEVTGNAALAAARMNLATMPIALNGADRCAGVIAEEEEAIADLTALASLKALGQIRDSFILAVNHDGLWIIDQHVAHERILFEKVLSERGEKAEGQRLLMPLIIEMSPGQLAIFSEIADELRANGFEVEPFGARSIAVKTAPAGVNASDVEKMLGELLEEFEREQRTESMDTIRHRIAASIACHAAIKVNMPLEQNKMEWLLRELALTASPMTCPHGRPVVLRYSVKDIQKAFKRI